MTETTGGATFTQAVSFDAPQIVECSCDGHECPELAEGTDLCLACRHGQCPDDSE